MEEQKLAEEIALLRVQQQDARRRLLLDWTKTIGLFAGAIVAFIIVTAPESTSKRNAEAIALYFEAIAIDEPTERAKALGLLRRHYNDILLVGEGGSEEQNTQLASLLRTAECNAVAVADYESLIEQLRQQEVEIQKEITGADGRVPGFGQRARTLSDLIAETKREILLLEEQLGECLPD